MRPNFENVTAGIDPGLQTTGWGIIHSEGSNVMSIASGSISPDVDLPLGERLLFIENKLDEMLKEFRPCLAGVEKTFAGAGMESAFLLGAARAACLVALARGGVSVREFSATHVKKSITGRGRADKQQMSYMVKMLLPASQCQNDHEADAFAIALTACWHDKPLKVAS